MSARFPILKGFEMKEEFSEMQEIKKHDPLYHGDKYHRVKFVYSSENLRIKSPNTVNSSEMLLQSESQCEYDGILKPYVPTLELEDKISELERKIKELSEQNEILLSKNKNFLTWNSSETDSKDLVSEILNDLVSSVSNSIFDIPDSQSDSASKDSSITQKSFSKLYSDGLDDVQEEIFRVVTSDGYVEYKEASAISSTDVVKPYQLESDDDTQPVISETSKPQNTSTSQITNGSSSTISLISSDNSDSNEIVCLNKKHESYKKQVENTINQLRVELARQKCDSKFWLSKCTSLTKSHDRLVERLSVYEEGLHYAERVVHASKKRQKKKPRSQSRKDSSSMQFSSNVVTPNNRRSHFLFNKSHVPFYTTMINKKATVISSTSSNSQHMDETHTKFINSSDLHSSVSNFVPFRKSIASHKWYLDSGCSKHMTGRKEILSNYTEEYGGSVKFGNNELAPVVGLGDIVCKDITIQNVAHVVGLNHNLFSIGKFCDKDLEVYFKKRRCVVRTEAGRELLVGSRRTNLYTIRLQHKLQSMSPCFLTRSSLRQAVLWHKRLSHLNFRYIDKIVKHQLVSGIPMIKFEQEEMCPGCEKGKMKRVSHPPKPEQGSKSPLSLLHMDLCGPMKFQSLAGRKYILVIVDDFSRYTWTKFLKSKDETSSLIINFIKAVQVQLNLPVQTVRTDNGTEFKNIILKTFYNTFGITQTFSAARTPEQNGVVERRNRTLVEAARSMLAESQLPQYLWAEAVNTACYTQNRSIIHRRFGKTPYHILFGRVPSVGHFKVFGCKCFVLNESENRGKFGPKSDELIFVGYSESSIAYRVLNKQKRVVSESINVRFDPITELSSDCSSSSSTNHVVNAESSSQDQCVTPESSQASYLDFLFQSVYDDFSHATSSSTGSALDSLSLPSSSNVELSSTSQNEPDLSEAVDTQSSNTSSLDIPDSASTSIQATSDVQDIPSASSTEPHVTNPSENPSEPSTTVHVDIIEPSTVNAQTPLPHTVKWTRSHPIELIIGDPTCTVKTRAASANECNFSVFLTDIEPTRVLDALQDSDWVTAMQEELNQFSALKVWRLVKRPQDKSIIDTKWLFKNKKDEHGRIVRNKARLVAKGYRQQEGIDGFLKRVFSLSLGDMRRLGFEHRIILDFISFVARLIVCFLHRIRPRRLHDYSGVSRGVIGIGCMAAINAATASIGRADHADVTNNLNAKVSIGATSNDKRTDDHRSNDKTSSSLSFADVVGQKAQTSLSFFPLEDKKGKSVSIPIELTKEAAKSFRTTVVGYFLGPRVPFPIVQRYLQNVWNKYGMVDVMMNPNGFFYIKFNDVGGCDHVVEEGMVMIRGIPMFIIPWDPSKGLRRPSHETCPLWVKFHNIPLVLFNHEGISRIASALDVWAVGELKRELEVIIPHLDGDGHDKVMIRVEYLWEPSQCSHCCVFGHKTTTCAKVVAKQAQLGRDKGKQADKDGFIAVTKKQWRRKDADKPGTSEASISGVKTNPNEMEQPTVQVDTLTVQVEDSVGSLMQLDKERGLMSMDALPTVDKDLGQPPNLSWKTPTQAHQHVLPKAPIKGILKNPSRSSVAGGLGTNKEVRKKVLWSGLRKFKLSVGSRPWFVAGDFNAMLFPHDALGGMSRRNQDMVDFFDCIEDVELFDVTYTGIHHTWCQKPKEESGLRRKLDRVLANVEFTSSFMDVRVRFLPRGISDHSPSILSFKGGMRKKVFGFKFDNFLVENSQFMQIVKDGWSMPVDGTFMFRVLTKLKLLKGPLKRLRSRYGNLNDKIQSLKVELDAVQTACDLDPFNDTLKDDLMFLRVAYQQSLWDEEMALRQRAKVRWLNEGDSNTKFFHKVIRERKHVNHISSICDMNGNFAYGDDVGIAFIDHLKSFMGKRDETLQPFLPVSCFQHQLSLAEANFMIRPITDEEIKMAMFSIGNDKAPGSDGFTSKFFKAAWDIVGTDVSVVVHNFFYRGHIAKQLNHTSICLLPKIPNATSVSDYRPIACCTVLYKCISKIIVNRMKPYLDGLVHRSQSAFIPGRRIVDNILMAHELVVGYHLNSGPPRCAFKIDLRKAYDMVDWRFLNHMLQGFSFHPVLVAWIEEMISTTSYSVVVNGEQRGFFKGERGIRQGDPLSPYLFTLIMEGFSMTFRQCIQEAVDFGFHPGCQEIDLTHLCCADDLFVFTRGDVASVEILKKALALFASRAGLSPNILKSDVFFGNVPQHEQQAILHCLPFRLGTFPIRYLGVPLSPHHLKVADYGGLITKVKARVQNWKVKYLSFGGRKQLIISVLQSLQLYWMAIYLFPSSVVHELEAIFRSFLWSQGERVQGI
ncbi:hypothetical protein OSB04_un000150 [Centaurea solstitialis]|uniref:Uncharacterized protein n=1 Tax=Centaurea solstitialis TaxID=347529 RepID=A0AA38VS75_9ASTR|nr:hypothetical protein OSB04_un000150 [Centaurea solstitialis]